MRQLFIQIEQPILFACSRLMSLVYRKFGLSPVRLLPLWQILVSCVELMGLAAVITFLYSLGERTLIYWFPVILISISVDLFTSYVKFKASSNVYDAKAYRDFAAKAQQNREDSLYLRSLSLMLTLGVVVTFSIVFQTEFTLAVWIAAVYFAAFSSKFYARACEPPHPDEGDYYAMPQAGRA